jgi:NTP pyrophosphatase (non-canonical NTP hydrolase)
LPGRYDGTVGSGGATPGEAEGTEAEVLDELGDVLFLAARIANLCGVSLEDSAAGVLRKIERRIADADR